MPCHEGHHGQAEKPRQQTKGSSLTAAPRLGYLSGEVRFSLDGLSSEAFISSNGALPVSLVFKEGENVVCALVESALPIADFS